MRYRNLIHISPLICGWRYQIKLTRKVANDDTNIDGHAICVISALRHTRSRFRPTKDTTSSSYTFRCDFRQIGRTDDGTHSSRNPKDDSSSIDLSNTRFPSDLDDDPLHHLRSYGIAITRPTTMFVMHAICNARRRPSNSRAGKITKEPGIPPIWDKEMMLPIK